MWFARSAFTNHWPINKNDPHLCWLASISDETIPSKMTDVNNKCLKWPSLWINYSNRLLSPRTNLVTLLRETKIQVLNMHTLTFCVVDQSQIRKQRKRRAAHYWRSCCLRGCRLCMWGLGYRGMRSAIFMVYVFNFRV